MEIPDVPISHSLIHVPTLPFQVSPLLVILIRPYIPRPSPPLSAHSTAAMIQTIHPFATSRTAEIMSRYRPIAPKPDPPSDNNSAVAKSPYLRNVWAHLQARPTRTRKRGRSSAAAFSPSSVKRSRPCLQGLSPPKNHSMHAFPHISIAPNLPLLYCAPASRAPPPGIDLNMTAEQPPEELDLLLHLAKPKPSVISPRPVRPVGSSIVVKRIADDPLGKAMAKRPEEVEEVVEAEAAPAIVSDSNNKVRMSNSAYKEMVGQPECCWLDCATGRRCRGGAGERIGGDVSLLFVDSEVRPSTAAFTCAVKIEWECEGRKMSVDAACSAVKLVCEAKDYQFLWRFHGVGGSKSEN